ncbi:DUF2785 domain-containing protein [Macrococcus brunensis]|nr:DUF2785 domain-containing protein [Macrococcus brunensis]
MIEDLLKKYKNSTSGTSEMLDRLLTEMLENIGHTDSHIRDQIIYNEFCQILLNNSLNREQISKIINQCIKNLSFNIGETNTDSVFTRSFSILFLHAIICYDNQSIILSERDFNKIIKNSLHYFKVEIDVRGWVEDKGWAHAPAHTSDLIVECIKSRYFKKNLVNEILEGINSNIFKLQLNSVCYIDDEDIRMSMILVSLLEERYITEKEVGIWLAKLKDYLETGASKKIEYYRKTKNYTDFIRALFFQTERFKYLQKNIKILLK